MRPYPTLDSLILFDLLTKLYSDVSLLIYEIVGQRSVMDKTGFWSLSPKISSSLTGKGRNLAYDDETAETWK